jgi:hypothetical protein
MSDREDDTGADLSKKERLINAWIAVGPEGKTTDVSDLTGSSRGYASDIRRAMAGEADDDDLSFEEITAAHEPELVEQYRSDLADDDIDGQWAFADRLEPVESSRAADEPAPPEPATGKPVPRSRTGPVDTSTQPPEPSPTTGPRSPATGQAGSQPPQQPPHQGRGSGGPPSQPSAPPHSGGHGPVPPSQLQGGSQSQPPTGGGYSPQPAHQRRTEQQQPAPVQPNQPAPPGFHQQLAELDRQLIAQQQQATAELNSFPQGSQAQNLAISKYNLVVDLRESLRQLATVAPGP